MQRFMTLLLDVWRAACRHIEIRESTAQIAPLLGKRLPVESVIVRRVDVEHSCLETVGEGSAHGSTALHDIRTGCDADELERVLAWCRRGAVTRLRDGHGEELRRLLLPPNVAGDVIAGPLCGDDGPVGILLLVAGASASFTEVQEELAAALLDPFTIALEHDRQIRDLKSHQEAAEAERRSLLTRLGRDDLSETIVGADTGLRHVMERVRLVAGSDVPVLLFGETGSGKEVIARAIHVRSGRKDGPFLRVNCGAIPPELIDSELFGHERGSFTGAIAMRKGWFERADGGTLFLDEVGELPLAAQVRLLRILQDGTFERVGGQRLLTVDVRVVAATNRDLQRMISERKFRDDLWYRLAVFPIHLPALRDRPEDMPALAAHFSLRAARRFGLPILTPSREDVNVLSAYSWPGNIRELASVINRAAILGDGKKLEIVKALGAVPPSIERPADSSASAAPPDSDAPLKTLDEAMRDHIERALNATQGRIEGPQGAARVLDINPHTLRARMRKLGIDWRRFRNPVEPAQS